MYMCVPYICVCMYIYIKYIYIHTHNIYTLEAWNIFSFPVDQITCNFQWNILFYQQTEFQKQEQRETFFWKSPRESSRVPPLWGQIVCPDPQPHLLAPYHPLVVSLSPPIPALSVIPHSCPIGRRAVWLPCIQRHLSPDLAGLPLRGAFSCVCHFGRAKGRPIYEDDRVLGDREQKVGREKLWGGGNIRTSLWVHEGEFGETQGPGPPPPTPEEPSASAVGQVLKFHLCCFTPSS